MLLTEFGNFGSRDPIYFQTTMRFKKGNYCGLAVVLFLGLLVSTTVCDLNVNFIKDGSGSSLLNDNNNNKNNNNNNLKDTASVPVTTSTAQSRDRINKLFPGKNEEALNLNLNVESNINNLNPSLKSVPSNSQFERSHRNAPNSYVLEDEICLGNYDVSEGTIIRTHDSQKLGAKYLNETDLGQGVKSRDECLRLCCRTPHCNVNVFEEKNTGSCYMFDCGPPEDFRCKFTSQPLYTSAILRKTERLPLPLPLPNLNQHETELNQLRTAEGGEGKGMGLSSMNEPGKNKFGQEIENDAGENNPVTTTTRATTTTMASLQQQQHQSHGDSANSQQQQQLRPAGDPQPLQQRRSQCTRNQFECKSSGECIAIYNACDGIPQCADGSDEASELHCPSDAIMQNALIQKQTIVPSSVAQSIVPLPLNPGLSSNPGSSQQSAGSLNGNIFQNGFQNNQNQNQNQNQLTNLNHNLYAHDHHDHEGENESENGHNHPPHPHQQHLSQSQQEEYRFPLPQQQQQQQSQQSQLQQQQSQQQSQQPLSIVPSSNSNNNNLNANGNGVKMTGNNNNNNGMKGEQILSSQSMQLPILPQQQPQQSLPQPLNIFSHKDGGIMDEAYGSQLTQQRHLPYWKQQQQQQQTSSFDYNAGDPSGSNGNGNNGYGPPIVPLSNAGLYGSSLSNNNNYGSGSSYNSYPQPQFPFISSASQSQQLPQQQQQQQQQQQPQQQQQAPSFGIGMGSFGNGGNGNLNLNLPSSNQQQPQQMQQQGQYFNNQNNNLNGGGGGGGNSNLPGFITNGNNNMPGQNGQNQALGMMGQSNNPNRFSSLQTTNQGSSGSTAGIGTAANGNGSAVVSVAAPKSSGPAILVSSSSGNGVMYNEISKLELPMGLRTLSSQIQHFASESENDVSAHNAGPGAVLAFIMGVGMSIVMVIIVGCRLRRMGTRRRGKNRLDPDYLVDGMYL